MNRRVEVPLAVLALLVLALCVVSVQGWRMAGDRFERLQPSRAIYWLEAGEEESVLPWPSDARFLVADLGEAQKPARVGLYQSFPERTLVRWLEPEAARASRRLVIPLEGLQPGAYLLVRVPPDAAAGPREMDLPTEELAVIGRFRLVSE